MIDDGGPAYPGDWLKIEDGHYEGRYEIAEQRPGMSLRDWFAGMALQGLLAACDSEGSWMGADLSTAMEAYKLADAMIAEKKRGEAKDADG